MRYLNMGCGDDIKSKEAGWVNLDKLDLKGVDVVHDLDVFPYPFESDTFDEVYCDNILEHLEDLSRVMQEIHRILKPGGNVVIRVPYFSQVGAFSDPTHTRFFTRCTMDYFCGLRRNYYDFGFAMIKKDIKFLFEYKKGLSKLLLGVVYLVPWLVYRASPSTYVWFLSYLFPASELHFELKKCCQKSQ